jgi:hypothetical protein
LLTISGGGSVQSSWRSCRLHTKYLNQLNCCMELSEEIVKVKKLAFVASVLG